MFMELLLHDTLENIGKTCVQNKVFIGILIFQISK